MSQPSIPFSLRLAREGGPCCAERAWEEAAPVRGTPLGSGGGMVTHFHPLPPGDPPRLPSLGGPPNSAPPTPIPASPLHLNAGLCALFLHVHCDPL